MSNGGGAFSAEEVAYLKSLPAVADATSRRITYAEEFKDHCVERYGQGASPVSLFREAGLDPALVGHKRIECAIARWRKARGVPKMSRRRMQAAQAGEGRMEPSRFTPDRSGLVAGPVLSGGQGDIRDVLIYQQVRRIDELEHQVLELTDRLRHLMGTPGHAGA